MLEDALKFLLRCVKIPFLHLVSIAMLLNYIDLFKVAVIGPAHNRKELSQLKSLFGYSSVFDARGHNMVDRTVFRLIQWASERCPRMVLWQTV